MAPLPALSRKVSNPLRPPEVPAAGGHVQQPLVADQAARSAAYPHTHPDNGRANLNRNGNARYIRNRRSHRYGRVATAAFTDYGERFPWRGHTTPHRHATHNKHSARRRESDNAPRAHRRCSDSNAVSERRAFQKRSRYSPE